MRFSPLLCAVALVFSAASLSAQVSGSAGADDLIIMQDREKQAAVDLTKDIPPNGVRGCDDSAGMIDH